ncbi:MAG TPA: sigma-70 family RNA polymerase sigma factor [Thermomicrobiales bacterium]|nr:sigma-70 family RNA polymerase sigma factor [Thermomicrobiales bacterium]
MTHDVHAAIHPVDAGRIAVRLSSSTRSRYRRRQLARRPATPLPEIGADDIILPTFEETLGSFAIRAQQGDRIARDALYAAYLPKLTRLAKGIRPPFAPDGAEGIWSRDDVTQEVYLVFVDLVDTWAGDVDFTAFLLSRFAWRLRDVVLRGIGKSSVPPRWRSVPIDDISLASAVATPEGDELLARILNGLPEQQVAILMAYAIEGRSKAAIARELGVSDRSVSRYWVQIRQHVAEVLAGEGR